MSVNQLSRYFYKTETISRHKLKRVSKFLTASSVYHVVKLTFKVVFFYTETICRQKLKKFLMSAFYMFGIDDLQR